MLLEVDERDELPVVVVPGIYEVIGDEAYCLMVNPEMSRKKVPKGTDVGKFQLLPREAAGTLNNLNGPIPLVAPTAKRSMKQFITKELKLDENEILKNSPAIKKRK